MQTSLSTTRSLLKRLMFGAPAVTVGETRLTADGTWFLCLYAERGVDLREPLRSGASDEELRHVITQAWTARTDRGAEERLSVAQRGALYKIDALRADPRREMHTRGG